MRLFGTANRNNTLYVVGDAHHDHVIIGHGCTAFLGHAGHIADSFNTARDAIQGFWPAATAYRYWGNSFRIRQCNGSHTRSDGYVLYAKAVVAGAASYHPTNTAQPHISGTPAVGATLTVDPGQWTGNRSVFVYQWCYVNTETDTCSPISGATSNTWTPQASDRERTVAVMVRPAGSSPTDAVISNTVQIVGQPPTAVTRSYEFTSNSTIKLNGTVDPNGTTTTYHFEYGPTTAYGQTTPSSEAGSGTSTLEVSAEVPAEVEGFNFTAAKPYVVLCFRVLNPRHYRLVASNAAGTSYGADEEVSECRP